MALKLNFKMGNRNALPAESAMKNGEVYFATDGNYGQIWYKNNSGKKINVVPETIECGTWDYTDIKDAGCCFVSGSKILLNFNKETKNIEEIKENDIVISYNVLTNSFYEAKVNKLVVNANSRYMARIYFDNGEMLEMTEYHPLYTRNGFHSLTNHQGYDTLLVGDEVKTFDGWSTITKIEQYLLKNPIATYSLDVIDFEEKKDNDQNDTFIVNGFVAHNAECPV